VTNAPTSRSGWDSTAIARAMADDVRT
jgi:hypothetical protein